MPSNLEAELLVALKDALEGMKKMDEAARWYTGCGPDGLVEYTGFITRAKEAIKKGEADAK